MKSLLFVCVLLVSSLALASSAAAREISPQARCFDETGTLAVMVIDTGPQAGSILVGSVQLADGSAFERRDLRFSRTRRHAVWQGWQFLLRVDTDTPLDAGRYLGRFRGLDDGGQPVVFRSLSCALLTR